MSASSTLNKLNLFELVQASYATRALFVLTKVGIFDELANGPKTLAELSVASKARQDILEDMLLFAVSLRFLRKSGGKYFAAKKGLLLTQRLGNWIRPYLLVWGEQLDPAFSHFEEYLLTGKNAFLLAHKDTIWDYYRRSPVQRENFVAFMHGVTHQSHLHHILDELCIGEAKNLVDVAGGIGSLACALANKYKALHCVVCDQPSNKLNADAYMSSLGVENCCFVGANIFGAIPTGSDLYTIKHVLHDWDDDDAVKILATISKAMRDDSRLIIIEGLLDRKFPDSFDNPEFLHTRNLEQRAWTPGRVRKAADFEELCANAGLRIVKFSHSSFFADVSYIECVKCLRAI
jgi:hypothetical protein